MAQRKRTLKQVLTGEPEDETQNIIPQLVAMGGADGFGYQQLPGMPINPPQTGSGMDMAGWAELIKKMMNQGQGATGEQGAKPGQYGPWRT